MFEAYRASEDRWTVRYRHPLSAYQAFNVAIAVLHNQTAQLLDHLTPLDEIMHAPEPQLTTNLAPIDTLSHAYGVVYSVCVYGSRIFCGTHSGHLQQWQCPIGAPPTVIEWRAHSGTVYALAVAGRSLVSASRDWLLRVWDLSSLSLVATLPGHRGIVRCLATHLAMPNRVYSGANDCTVRVWDVNTLQGGDPKRKEVLKGHKWWVRALVCSADGSRLCSAARHVRVWDTETLQCLHALRRPRNLLLGGVQGRLRPRRRRHPVCRLLARQDPIVAVGRFGEFRRAIGRVPREDGPQGEGALVLQPRLASAATRRAACARYDLSTLPIRAARSRRIRPA